ncbi:hypothetical protein DOTSEDRAFT_72390 [Dothistroma septosporum NZE10]|uniref:Lytic polysaccharide monooxygenase n=1 Tax=Dothistroma septosporum (strain NZE10 / CBS 128990) TaxID=675120 RepID=M2WLP0_DOTSN|nr:hypothetical protein DOTSEDRAFT_72390 [Dothistroma septosporum NZE10]
MFSNTIFIAAVACGLLATSVNAHMVITSPVPYGQDSLTNSPLEADGSDFPCKQRAGVYDMTTMNTMAVGVPQTLKFKGGATHGGGSCQLSITTDQQPSKSSKWKVIHSIIGGCPNGAVGNANGSPDYDQNPTFEFSIPKDVPNGKYTLAWTWFNKIGNREMYMNCAPLTVTGGSSKNKRSLDTLPDMFVANIGNGCTVAESQDFVFPQCGLYAETAAKTALGSSTSGTCATASAGGSGSGSGSSAVAPSVTASYGSALDSSAAAPTATGYGSGSGAAATSALAAPAYGGAASSATSAIAAPAYSSPSEQASGAGAGDSGMQTIVNMHTVTTIQTVTGTGEAPAGYTPPAAYSGSSGGASSDSESTAQATTNGTSSSSTGSCAGQTCTNDGDVVCIGSDQWGICDAGCAVARSLADGTTCSNGVISKRSDQSAHLRRHIYNHGRSF